jgi:excisionase family DNA binding protein
MSQNLKPAVPRISQALNISTSSAKRLIADGLIPVVRVGRQLRIDEEQLARWIATGGAGSFKRDRLIRGAPASPTGGDQAA